MFHSHTSHISKRTNDIMPSFALLISAEVENITKIAPVEGRHWGLKFECNKCKETGDKFVYIDEEESEESGGGNHNAIWSCKFCKNQISADVNTKSYGEFDAEKSSNPQKVIVFDVRGAEPVDLEWDGSWIATAAESEETFEDVDLSDDWCDYDEKSSNSVSIMNPVVKFEKTK